jgi:hypothetical protein
LALGLSAVADGRSQPPAETPAELYRALLKEFQTASGGGPATDAERMKFIGQV